MPEPTREMLDQLKRIEEMPDSEINLSDPDARESAGTEGWVRGEFYRPIKKPISLRVDMDILDWYKTQEGKYQSLMNEALREYMENHST